MGDRYGRPRPGLVGLALAVAVGLILSACSSGGSPSPQETAQATATVRIGVLVTLTGPGADSGRGALESVRRVVADRQGELEEAGLLVEVAPADDRGQQSVGQQQATTLADDPATIGIIGTTESRVDEGVQPILARDGLLTLSLGGSEPALTRTVEGRRTAFTNYVTLSAQRLDRPRVAASMIPRRATSLVLRGPRREDSAMADVFVKSRVKAGSPEPLVQRVPTVTNDEAFEPAASAALRAQVRIDRPEAVYVVADPATEWATIVGLREVLPLVPIIADEDVLGPWPETVVRAEEQAVERGVTWGPLWTTTAGATPGAADVRWPLASPTASPSPTEGGDSGEDSAATDDEAIAVSRFSVSAHDAAQALVDGLLATWDAAGATKRSALATAPADDAVTPTVIAWRTEVAREVEGSRQRGLLGPYVFDARGVASRRLVGVYRATEQTWSEGAPREVIGPCGTGSCAVRVR